MKSIKIYIYLWIFWYFSQNFFDTETHNSQLMEKTEIQVERTWDLVRDSGQRKLTSSFQNHCTLHSVPVGAKPLSPRQCAPSRSIYLSRRLNSHWEILVTIHHLQDATEKVLILRKTVQDKVYLYVFHYYILYVKTVFQWRPLAEVGVSTQTEMN